MTGKKNKKKGATKESAPNSPTSGGMDSSPIADGQLYDDAGSTSVGLEHPAASKAAPLAPAPKPQDPIDGVSPDAGIAHQLESLQETVHSLESQAKTSQQQLEEAFEELAKVKQAKGEVESKVKMLEHQKAEAEAERSKAQKDAQGGLERIIELEKVIATKLADLDASVEERRSLKAKVGSLEGQLKKVREDQDLVVDRVQHLTEDKKILGEKLAELDAAKAGLESQVQVVTGEREAARSELQAVKDAKRKADEQQKAVEAKLAVVETREKTLGKQAKALLDEKAAALARLDEANASKTALQGRIQSLESSLKTAQEDSLAAARRVKVVEKELAAREKELAAREKALQEADAAKAAVNKKVTALEDSMAHQARDADAKSKAWAAERKKEHEKLRNAEQQRDAMERKFNTSQEMLRDSDQRGGAWEQGCKEAQAKLIRAEGQLEAAHAEHRKAEKESAALVDGLRGQLADIEDKLKWAEGQLEAAHAEHRKAEQESAALVDGLRGQVAGLEMRMQDSDTSLVAARAERDAAVATLQQLQEEKRAAADYRLAYQGVAAASVVLSAALWWKSRGSAR